MNKTEERLNALAKVVPAEVAEMFRAYFQMVNASNQLNIAYDKANPDYAKKDYLNEMYVADKHNTNLAEVENKIWKRACFMLESWLSHG